jgi:exodeoxyribonuclease VII large subunit
MSPQSSQPPDDDALDRIGMDDEHPLSVSQLTMCIKRLLEGSLPKLWVEGEISDLSRPSSGHLYMTLKDQHSQIRAVMWRSAAQRLPFRLEDGQSIICAGGVEVYAPRGSYQLVISRAQPKGIGSLQLAFRQLHARLASEGLFDPQRKRPLPVFPKRIGFVTSPSGAALHDFIEAARGRWPLFELVVIPAKVQGAGAAADIVAGIQAAALLRPAIDLLIVGRGGGSLEDLWCFNEEPVVRALAASSIPTISAVGHEVDVTLSDLAADQRALTPTHAAELALPSRTELASRLHQTELRLASSMHARIRLLRQRVERAAESRVLRNPHELIKMRRQMIDEWELRAAKAAWSNWRGNVQRLQGLARAAHALSPLQVLGRGYSLSTRRDDGTLVRSISDCRTGDELVTTLEDGRMTSRVIGCEPAEPFPVIE